MEKATGRKKCMYGGYRPRSLEHDKYVTDLVVYGYPELKWTRGNNLERNADAIFEMNSNKVLLEFETGSMPLERIRDKWLRNYADCEDKLFVVTLDEQFLEDVIAVSDVVAGIASFGVLKNVTDDPHGHVWRTL